MTSDVSLAEQAVNKTSNQTSNGTSIEPASTTSVVDTTENTLLPLLPDSMREDPRVTKFKNIEGLVRGYLDAETAIGGSFRKPTSESKEDWDKFYDKLGRPEAPDKYDLALDERQKKLMDASGDVFKEFLSEAHGSGLSNEQAKKLTQWYMNKELTKLTEENESIHKEREATREALQKDWGDEFDSNFVSVGKLLKKYEDVHGSEPVSKLRALAGDNLVFWKILHDLSLHNSVVTHEPNPLGNDRGGSTIGITQQDAMNKIKDLRADKTNAYNDKYHKEHEQAVQEMASLYKVAFPNPEDLLKEMK